MLADRNSNLQMLEVEVSLKSLVVVTRDEGDFDFPLEQSDKCLRTELFTIYPCCFEVNANDDVEVVIEYSPLSIGKHTEDFLLLIDNGDVQEFNINGESRVVNLSISDINDKYLADSQERRNANQQVITYEKNINFRPTAIQEEAHQEFVVANDTGLSVEYGGNKAFYSPSKDLIRLPNTFNSASGFVSTFAHEIGHSTGHQKRLDRFSSNDKAFNTYKESYAFEELCAELFASFLCADLKVNGEHENHASYLSFWLKALKEDKTFLFKASSAASKAYQYLMNLSCDNLEEVA